MKVRLGPIGAPRPGVDNVTGCPGQRLAHRLGQIKGAAVKHQAVFIFIPSFGRAEANALSVQDNLAAHHGGLERKEAEAFIAGGDNYDGRADELFADIGLCIQLKQDAFPIDGRHQGLQPLHIVVIPAIRDQPEGPGVIRTVVEQHDRSSDKQLRSLKLLKTR